jgi:hypothetical protein
VTARRTALRLSWHVTLFDTTSVHAKAAGFGGSVFDGRYLYLAPAASGVVARFDAKTPSSRPCQPSFFGSFY